MLGGFSDGVEGGSDLTRLEEGRIDGRGRGGEGGGEIEEFVVNVVGYTEHLAVPSVTRRTRTHVPFRCWITRSGLLIGVGAFEFGDERFQRLSLQQSESSGNTDTDTDTDTHLSLGSRHGSRDSGLVLQRINW